MLILSISSTPSQSWGYRAIHVWDCVIWLSNTHSQLESLVFIAHFNILLHFKSCAVHLHLSLLFIFSDVILHIHRNDVQPYQLIWFLYQLQYQEVYKMHSTKKNGISCILYSLLSVLRCWLSVLCSLLIYAWQFVLNFLLCVL